MAYSKVTTQPNSVLQKNGGGNIPLIIQELFKTIEIEGIKYCLITDYEPKNLSKDIDIYVFEANQKDFLKILKHEGWKKRKAAAYHPNHHFYYKWIEGNVVCLDIKFQLIFADIILSNRYRQVRYRYKKEAEALNTCRKNNNDTLRPTGWHAIALYAGHMAFLERGKLEPRHKHAMLHYTEEEMQHINSEEERRAALAIKSALLHEKNDRELILKIQKIILNSFTKAKPHYNIGYPKLRSNQFNALFLGMDDSGKSTLIDYVKSNTILKCSSSCFGEKGWHLPEVQTTYKQPQASRLFEKILYTPYQYVIYPFKLVIQVLKMKIQSDRIMLIDNHLNHLLLGNSILYNFYAKILPKPDLIFFLTNQPAKPGAQITGESAKVTKLSTENTQIITINTAVNSVQECHQMVISNIFQHKKYQEEFLKPPC